MHAIEVRESPQESFGIVRPRLESAVAGAVEVNRLACGERSDPDCRGCGWTGR